MRRLCAFLLVLALAGCAPAPAPAGSEGPEEPARPAGPAVSVPDTPVPQAPPEEADPRQAAVDALLSSMTPEEKVGQLFFPRCPKTDGAALAAEYHLGGYLLFQRNTKNKSADQLREEIASYQSAAKIPLLIGADEEGGSVVRISSNPQLRPERFPSPQALYAQGGLEAVLADAREKDALLRSLGINVNFAPVADLSTVPTDFIYSRTLGLGAEETAAYVAAVVEQMSADGMGSVLKHFPGYGDNGDTHTGLARDSRPLDRFRQADFLPFLAGMDAGAGAVLVSHNVMEAADPELPASLSPAVHALLREELGFEGVALTDDLAMGAVAEYAREGSAPVLALRAGCDMVVTTDFQTQIPQVLAALEAGELSMDTVDRACTRVLGWKYDLGLLPET